MNDLYVEKGPPTTVHAWQYQSKMDETVCIPYWVLRMTIKGTIKYSEEKNMDVLIRGDQEFELNDGDWIILAATGHYWLMDNGKFQYTYTPVPQVQKRSKV